jgi:hypothetical protein
MVGCDKKSAAALISNGLSNSELSTPDFQSHFPFSQTVDFLQTRQAPISLGLQL